MPEIASLPILSSVSHSASSTATTASSGISGSAKNTFATTAKSSTSSNTSNDANLPADQGNASFANILKHQMDQPATAATPPAAQLELTADLNLTVMQPLNAALLVGLFPELTAQPTTDSALLPAQDDKQSLITLLAANLIGKPKADPAAAQGSGAVLTTTEAGSGAAGQAAAAAAELATTLAAQATAETLPTSELNADQLAKSLFSFKTGNERAGRTDGLSDRTTDQDATQTPAIPDSSLAALLAFFPPPTPASMVKANAITVPTDAAREDSPGQSMPTPLILQSGQNKDGDTQALQTNLDEMPQATADKAADFAAPQALSADIATANTNDRDSANPDIHFENLLTAAQAQIANHGQGRDIRTPVHANDPIKMQTSVGANGWDNEVGEKLVWMVGRQEQRAELVLNPPQLGRVEISLTMGSDQQTSATFISSNPAVRDALETALPRLREMFADAGLSLGQAQVGSDSGNPAANPSAGNQGNRDNSSRFSNGRDVASDGNMLHLTGTSQWTRQGSGLVDVFA